MKTAVIGALLAGLSSGAIAGETFVFTGQPYTSFSGPEPNPFRGQHMTLTITFDQKLPHSMKFPISSRKGSYVINDGVATQSGTLSGVGGDMRVRDNQSITFSSFHVNPICVCFVCSPNQCHGYLFGGPRQAYYEVAEDFSGTYEAVSYVAGAWVLQGAPPPNLGQLKKQNDLVKDLQ